MLDQTYDAAFNEAYETTYARLSSAHCTDDASLERVKAGLDALCRQEALGWTGRSEIMQATTDGTIAAYQAFLMRNA